MNFVTINAAGTAVNPFSVPNLIPISIPIGSASALISALARISFLPATS